MTLPGSFAVSHGDYRCQITYKVKAMVTAVLSQLAIHKTTQHLQINERLNTAVLPVSLEKHAEVMFLCCIPRGSTSVY